MPNLYKKSQNSTTPSDTWHQKGILENYHVCSFGVACWSLANYTTPFGTSLCPNRQDSCIKILDCKWCCLLFILGLFKVSKRCVNPYKCCLTLFFIPLVVAICIGFGLLADFHSWNIAYNEKDYKFCDPFIFIFAYGLNIIDYFIFSGYAITAIINHYCSRAIYCCGEIVQYHHTTQ